MVRLILYINKNERESNNFALNGRLKRYLLKNIKEQTQKWQWFIL